MKIVDSNDDAVVEYSAACPDLIGDALGRRIEKKDHIDSSNTRRYYYSNKWQVLEEYDSSDTLKDRFLYGNYIDEVIATIVDVNTRKYYVHDHLFSPVALVNFAGTVLERCEYDAYGRPHILDADFTEDADNLSDYDNPYLFTGRRVDILDSANLKLQYNRNRYYDYHIGRWLTQDPKDYVDGLNLMEYAGSDPAQHSDPNGTSFVIPDIIMRLNAGSAVCGPCTQRNRTVTPWPYDRAAPPAGWFLYGSTTPYWNATTGVASVQGFGGCKSVVMTTCSCEYDIKYYSSARVPDGRGRSGRPRYRRVSPPLWLGSTPKRHEEAHVAKINRAWDELRRKITDIRVRSMATCPHIAQCYADALDLWVKRHEAHRDYINYQYDVNTYDRMAINPRIAQQYRSFVSREWLRVRNIMADAYAARQRFEADARAKESQCNQMRINLLQEPNRSSR